MSEEEKETQSELFEIIIGKKMKPLYWIHGTSALAILAIFVSIAWPISEKVIGLSVKAENCIKSDEAYQNFITKGNYYILQRDEHEADINAIRNPQNADLIYLRLNNEQKESLELINRSSEPAKNFLR